jgi:hypothetical protein
MFFSKSALIAILKSSKEEIPSKKRAQFILVYQVPCKFMKKCKNLILTRMSICGTKIEMRYSEPDFRFLIDFRKNFEYNHRIFDPAVARPFRVASSVTT